MTSIINLYPDPLQEKSIVSPEEGFISFMPPFSSKEEMFTPALFIQEVISEEASLFDKEENDDDERPIDMLQVLNEINEAPPEAGETSHRSGFSKPSAVKHNPFPIHSAAGKGDVAEINRLIRTGFDVNSEDDRSAMPLVDATIFGQVEAVKALLKAGINVNDKCYEGQTALHIALEKKQYEIARILVQNGADPKTKSWDQLSPTTMAFKQLETAVSNLNLQKASTQLQNEISEIINTLETFSRSSGKQSYLNLTDTVNGAYQIPLSVALKTTAGTAFHAEVREMIQNLSELLAKTDPLNESYISAKNLLSSFPSGKTYTINSIKLEGGEPFKILANGHYKHYTTPMAKDSLTSFVEKLNGLGANDTKLNLFTKIRDIFETAAKFVDKAAEPATAEAMNALFHAGETVLLPTQWGNHFINVIVSKTQNLLAVANAGERYALDKPGIMLLDLQKPENIDSDFMHKVLTNKDRKFIEFYMHHEYGPMVKLGTIDMPNQIFGNCTWESHRNAVKGLLYIELLNQGATPEAAETQAHQYFKEWDAFHGQYILEQYFSHAQILPANALGDIYLEIQKKKAKSEFTQTDEANSKLLMKVLHTETYQSEYKSWMKSLGQADAQVVKATVDPIHAEDGQYYSPFKFLANLFKAVTVDAAAPLHAAHPEHHDGVENPHQDPGHF